jgi:serine/threonine-protein kinase
MIETDEIRIPILNDRIGSLRIIETVASGGMAIVYKVVHEELEVQRALKMLKPGCKKEFKKRLLTEAKIAAHLHHPNIVQIYNAALWNDANPYIEMEFVEGTSLIDIIAVRGKVPFIVASSVASIICAALEYAGHQKIIVYGKEYYGLVHRDIKPANIMLSSAGAVKLMDFGIALPGNESIHTTDATVMGTGPYLSPEQIDGERLDQRTDIYSLGAVLYEMIAGVKAYPQKKMSELLRDKLRGKYLPLRNIIDDVPESCADLITTSLQRDRDKRFADAGEFGRALNAMIAGFTDKDPAAIVREYVENNGIISIDHTTGRKKHPSTNTRFVIGIVVAFAAISLAMTAIIWLAGRASNQRNIRIAPHNAAQPAALPTPAAEPRADMDRPSAAPAPIVPQPAAKPALQSVVAAGLAAYGAGKFMKARTLLASALDTLTNPGDRKTVVLRLFDCWAETGPGEDALTFGDRHPVEDGFYYLVKGKAYSKAGDYAQSEESLTRAQRIYSMFGQEVRREAAFHIGDIRRRLYDRKPNLDNLNRAHEAWKSYADEFCPPDMKNPQCERAFAELAELSNLMK